MGLTETDINWAELDGRLRRLSSSNEHKGGSMKDELEMRRMQARELKRLAAELRNRLRHSEMRRVVGRGSASQAKAEVEERLEVAVDDFRSMEASVNHLQEQVRQHAGEIEAKETTIVKQSAEVQALKRKVTQQSEDLAVIREELATSKRTHLADIRAAQEACDLLRSRVAKEQAHSEGIRQQLHGVRATVSELQEALTAQKKLAKQASRDLEDAQVGKAAVEQTRRLYEDAKYEADRFRREAARLAKLLGQESRPEAGKAVGKKDSHELKMVSRVVRTGGGYANHVNVAGGEVDASDDLMSALFGKDNHSLGSATAGRSSKKGVKKLRREWQACPGGLSFIGEEGEGVAEKVTAVGKMATRGGNSFANSVHVSEAGVAVKEGTGWVPARAIDVMSNFRRCFCPEMSWAVIEMVLLLLDKIWKEREGQRLAALQQRHRSAIRAARRHANQVKPMMIVRQKDRIIALEEQLEKAKLVKRLSRAASNGRGGLAGAALEKQMELTAQVERLGVENLQLRDVLKKAASAVEQVHAIHRDGAGMQARQAVKALDGARERMDGLMEDARQAVTAVANIQTDKEITAALLKAHVRLSEGIDAVMRACEAEAQRYHPPSSDHEVSDSSFDGGKEA